MSVRLHTSVWLICSGIVPMAAHAQPPQDIKRLSIES
jgi:hypothetical protein